jgi:hypothetical protein
VLRSNSATQIEQAFVELYSLNEAPGKNINLDEINSQTKEAIEAVRNGQRWWTCRRLRPEYAVWNTNWHARPNWYRIPTAKNPTATCAFSGTSLCSLL